MKKSGIILCCFALVLVLAGVILCFVGKGMGDVFDNTVISKEDHTVQTPINTALNYIVVEYSDVTVNVYGGAESDYIQTVNIDEAQIDTSRASAITISDQKDFLSMAYDTVTNFSGLRGILFPGKSYSGEKTVNIYLSGAYNVTQLKFHIGNGTIQVQNLDSNTDYSLRISGEGNVSLDQVSTSSQIHVETGTGNITLNSVSCQLLSGNIHTGNLHCYEQDPGGHLYELACENGMVYLLEQSQGNTYTVSDADDSSKIQFSVINGNIHLNQAEK